MSCICFGQSCVAKHLSQWELNNFQSLVKRSGRDHIYLFLYLFIFTVVQLKPIMFTKNDPHQNAMLYLGESSEAQVALWENPLLILLITAATKFPTSIFCFPLAETSTVTER